MTKLCALLSLLMTFAAAHVHAESDDPPGYAEAVKLGVAEFAEKNFVEARSQFARAHALNPNARTLRALGMVAFELKNYRESAGYLAEALRSPKRALDAETHAQTEELLRRAEGYIGRFKLDIEPGTQLSVDGSHQELGPGSDLTLEVGDHVLEFRAPGRISDRRTLKVQGGESETLRVTLAELDSVPPTKADEDKPRERRAYRSAWLWTALGVVVAGAAAGTAVAFARGGATKTEAPYTGTGGAPALGAPP